MRCIFLAAGRGSRLMPLTSDRPKCLVEFRGQPFLSYAVETARACGISDLVVVRGYRGDRIDTPGCDFRDNLVGGNMVASLMSAADSLQGDVIVSYTDILYELEVFARVALCPANIAVAVDLHWRDYFSARAGDANSIAETLRIENGLIVEIGTPAKSGLRVDAQFIGLIKFDASVSGGLQERYDRLKANVVPGPWRNSPGIRDAFMTDFLQELIDSGIPVVAVPVRGGWIEIDTVADYRLLENWDAEGTLSRFLDTRRMVAGVGSGHPRVTSAGGLLLRKSGSEWTCALIGRGNPTVWRIPKGMRLEGETLAETAERELLEETGLSGSAIEFLDSAGWTYTYADRLWNETCFFFTFEETGPPRPVDDEEVEVVEFFPLQVAATLLAYETERRVCIRLLERLGSKGGAIP